MYPRNTSSSRTTDPEQGQPFAQLANSADASASPRRAEVVATTEIVELQSDAPWHVTLRLERVASDLLCSIRAGNARIGAVASSQWREGGAKTSGSTSAGDADGEIAEFTSRSLCKSARMTVRCAAGIHFDGLAGEDVPQVTSAALDLSLRAARLILDRRIAQDLHSTGTLAHLEADLEPRLRSLTEFLAQPMHGLSDSIRPALAEARAHHFHDEVQLFAPLYVSNACQNECVYCGFRKSAGGKRLHLSVEDAVEGARTLADAGHRTIDVVSGEIPFDPFVDYLCRVVERILAETPIRRIHVNVGALSTAQLRRLRTSGATGYHLYQETYDPETFRAVHVDGPKRDMAYRLEAPRRACEAGFEAIGLGILLGLRPVERELAMLVNHAHWLKSQAVGLRLGFSLPRIQAVDAECRYQSATPVDDDTFVKALLYLRREFPDAHIALTTRESAAVRDDLIPLCITRVSAGVSTAPGGYGHAHGTVAHQFTIRDRRSLAEVSEAIRAAGLRPSVA